MIIYKTTNLINNKIYIGKDEFNNDSYLGSGVILLKAINKYGKFNFKKEILETCNSSQELCDREKYWIKYFDSTNKNIGYNIAEGGTGGNTYYGMDENKLNDVKRKISKKLKNRIFTDNHRKKLSISAKKRKGNKPCKFKGKKYSDIFDIEKTKEIKCKISESLKEHYKDGMPLEQRSKISKSTKGIKKGPFSKNHVENMKKSFKKRDINRKIQADLKWINLLESEIKKGINNDNYDDIKKYYKKVKYRGLNISKYEYIIPKLKKIEYYRRSRAQSK